MTRKLASRFRDRDYRHEYTEAFFDTLVAGQLRALRKKLGLTQKEMGEKTGTTQSGISSFESEDYSRWSVSTLRRFARVFDVAVVVKFASFSDAAREIEEFGDRALAIPGFDEDPAFQAPKEAAESVESGATDTGDDVLQFRITGNLVASGLSTEAEAV